MQLFSSSTASNLVHLGLEEAQMYLGLGQIQMWAQGPAKP